MLLDWFLRDSSQGEKHVTSQESQMSSPQFYQSISLQLQEFFRDILRLSAVIPIMTYESAIKYFVTDRPSDLRVKKGAILRQSHPQGHHLVQVFLDAQNQLILRPDGKPYGRQLVAREVDEELSQTFGDQNLIIVE